MNGSGCKNCPVNPCKTMNYRGSTCAAQRAKFGLGDPQTNADRIRAMSDEELSKIINAFTAYFEDCNRRLTDTDCHDCELYELCSLGEGKAIDWLKQPAK